MAERATRGRQPLYLHVGLPKSGTTFLQALMATNRGRLKEAGFIYPFVRREGMFHAAVELRGQHEAWGLDPAVVDGTWQQLLERVRRFEGAGIISHELLAGATPEQVARVAADVADLDLHVLVTVRDLPRQVSAYWQEDVKNGRAVSFEEFSQALLQPQDAEHETGFWRSQNLPTVLERWGAAAADDHLHVVVVPPRGADPLELWRRFARSVGLDATTVSVEQRPRSNESLGAAQVALLADVVRALDGRLGQPHYAHVVKRFFAQNLLAGLDSPRPVTPPALREQLDAIVAGWTTELGSRGYVIHGDLGELRSPLEDEQAPHPDDVPVSELHHGVPEVIAELLVEIATLRTQVDGPKRLPPLAPPSE